MQRTRLSLLPALLALALLGGCDLRVATEPTYQPQVINLRNDFGFQVASFTDATDDIVYTWQNDGTVANVVQAPSNLTGSATLFVSDGSGVQVYQRSLAENGTFSTTTGTPGMWTVRVLLEDANGALAFRLAKP